MPLKNYTPPEGFTTKAEREGRKKAQDKREQEGNPREKERKFSEWLKLSDEEKIKGDLWIWPHRFKKEQGKEPTMEEIHAKKQELISKLPTPEEKRKRFFNNTMSSYK